MEKLNIRLYWSPGQDARADRMGGMTGATARRLAGTITI